MTTTTNKPNDFNDYTDKLMDNTWNDELGCYTVENNDEELDKVCKTCKFHKDCEQCGWYFGCGVWDVYMGDDL